MAKPKWIIGAGVAIAVSVVVASYWVLQPAPRVTPSNCESLHPGMTFGQVKSC